jgi:hypothetical protein
MNRRCIKAILSAPAAIFYCVVASCLYEGMGSPRGISGAVAALTTYVFATSLGLWVLRDAEDRGRPLPYDYGSFVYFAWWAVLPVYLWWTRRWRGFVPFLWFLVLCAAGIVLGNIPAWLEH